jgi:hypothetical protein
MPIESNRGAPVRQRQIVIAKFVLKRTIAARKIVTQSSAPLKIGRACGSHLLRDFA